VNEGGASVALAPLLPQYDSWFNKCPLNFKFLDFFELVNTLIYWYIRTVESQVEAIGQITYVEASFSFTQQDFFLMVRQAVLSFFKDQWIGQFMWPLLYDFAKTNFLPFQILGNCYGNDAFKRLLVPLMVADNLSMLHTQKAVYTGKTSKINNVYSVPVWGYYNDVQPIWTFPTGVPVFAVAPQSQISLVDGSIGGVTYVNLNSAYYQQVSEIWNQKVTDLKAYTNVCDISNMSPPGFSLLRLTRTIDMIPDVVQNGVKVLPPLHFPSLSYISNLKSLKKQKSVKDIEKGRITVPSLPPPTAVEFYTIKQILSIYPVMKEVHTMLSYMILPSVRLDPIAFNDVLNETMYVTITGEGLSQPQLATANGPGYLNRQLNAANMCVEGIAKEGSSQLSKVFNRLVAEGKGGMLAGLLGGFAKNLFPDASGTIDTISSIIPF
jgi:hypothetical protein